MDHLLARADARRLPLASNSVHCCITSPPYLGLRDYGTGEWEGGDPGCDHAIGPARKDGNRRARSGTFEDGERIEGHEGGMLRYRAVCGKCGARRVDRQIGLEPDPSSYVAALVAAMREVRRVLRDDGCLWLNLGDSYAANNPIGNRADATSGLNCIRPGYVPPYHSGVLDKRDRKKSVPAGLKPKDLIGVPWRFAFALQADGWYLRSCIPWIKPSPMPESTEDRPGTSHEYVFLLTKRERYFYDGYAVKKKGQGRASHCKVDGKGVGMPGFEIRGGFGASRDHEWHERNRRTGDWCLESVAERVADLEAEILQRQADLAELQRWLSNGGLLHDAAGLPVALHVATTPYSGAHFATFPPKLVKPMILAGSSERGCCAACGGPWVREVEREEIALRPNSQSNRGSDASSHRSIGQPQRGSVASASTTLGWSPTCACAAPVVPCTILDPFCGAGTVALVATGLGRHAISCDLSAEYLAMARHRVERPHSRPARAATNEEHHPLFDRD